MGHSDWLALYRNLSKAQQRWIMVWRVLVKAGMVARSWVVIYKVVVHMVMLCGSESWVKTDAMLKVLENFHH